MRGRFLRVLALVGVLAALAASPVLALQTIVRSLDPVARAELRRLRAEAKRAKPAAAEEAWILVARLALQSAASADDPRVADDPEAASALREACGRLSAPSLAAVARAGAHPILSEAFCRTVAGHGPAGVPGAAEAAAEARDGLVAFGGVAGKALLDVVRRGDEPASGAGAMQRSVYQVRVIGVGVEDSTTAAYRVAAGLKRGIAAAAGAWAGRFNVFAHGGNADELGASLEADHLRVPGGPGVVVVAAGSAMMVAATTAALEDGVIVADARSPGELESRAPGELPFDRPGDSVTKRLESGARGGRFGESLEYMRYTVAGDDTQPEFHRFRPFLLRPTSVERGRRLAESLLARADVRRVAIAIPSEGADLEMAIGFLAALRAMRREPVVLEYDPGRRDYAPEAHRFVGAKAQALLFAGPGEESGEWLAALAKVRQAPLVLGTSELNPAGHHAQVRGRLEGAIYVGDDWLSYRDSDWEKFMGTQDGLAQDPDARRGYLFGLMLARDVVEGAWSPTRLRVALEARSLPRMFGQAQFTPVGIQRKWPGREMGVPLYVVRKGVAELLSNP